MWNTDEIWVYKLQILTKSIVYGGLWPVNREKQWNQWNGVRPIFSWLGMDCYPSILMGKLRMAVLALGEKLEVAPLGPMVGQTLVKHGRIAMLSFFSEFSHEEFRDLP